MNVIGLLGRHLSRVTRNWLASRRCSMGEGSVVYFPTLVNVEQGGRERIVIGRNSHIRGELVVLPPGGAIEIGDYCYLGVNSRIWSFVHVSVGNRVLIAHNVSIMDSLTHPFDPAVRHEQFKRIITEGHPADIDLGARPIAIQDDAWIGCNAVILRGVVIGNAAVVAAGSVVTRDVPPYTIVAGNPARAIRQLRRPGLEEVGGA